MGFIKVDTEFGVVVINTSTITVIKEHNGVAQIMFNGGAQHYVLTTATFDEVVNLITQEEL